MQFNFVKLLAITAAVASASVAAAASVIEREVWRFLLYFWRVYYWHTNEDGRRACSPRHSLDLWPRWFHSKNRPSQSRDQLHQPRFSLQEEYLLRRGFRRRCLWLLRVSLNSPSTLLWHDSHLYLTLILTLVIVTGPAMTIAPGIRSPWGTCTSRI